MKKRILICISALLLMAICVIGIFSVRSSKIVGEEGLIEKARKEIKNLAEVETIEMAIAGKSTIERKSTKENDRHLFWIITGNEYQAHRYYPLEVIEVENGEYKFVRLHHSVVERGQDIFFARFGGGYSFMINNPKCKSIMLGETIVPVTELPFVYYCRFVPNEYYFLDAEGNTLN